MSLQARGRPANPNVQLSISRDLSRLVYKPPSAKVSSFIRVVDIEQVEDLKRRAVTPLGSGRSGKSSAGESGAGRHLLVLRAKGAKEFRVGMGSAEDKRALIECLVLLLANKGFLASLKATVENAAE